jgi:hypothetical protein
MLERPEIGTRGHVLLWLGGKLSDEAYPWTDTKRCAAAQYAEQMELANWQREPTLSIDNDGVSLSTLARDEPHTFGALYERARKAWHYD